MVLIYTFSCVSTLQTKPNHFSQGNVVKISVAVLLYFPPFAGTVLSILFKIGYHVLEFFSYLASFGMPQHAFYPFLGNKKRYAHLICIFLHTARLSYVISRIAKNAILNVSYTECIHTHLQGSAQMIFNKIFHGSMHQQHGLTHFYWFRGMKEQRRGVIGFMQIAYTPSMNWIGVDSAARLS